RVAVFAHALADRFRRGRPFWSTGASCRWGCHRSPPRLRTATLRTPLLCPLNSFVIQVWQSFFDPIFFIRFTSLQKLKKWRAFNIEYSPVITGRLICPFGLLPASLENSPSERKNWRD